MTAAERAEALLAGRAIDCPRCGNFPMRQEAPADLGPFFGGLVQGEMICASCGFMASPAFCGVAGGEEDASAAIHILDRKPREGENP